MSDPCRDVNPLAEVSTDDLVEEVGRRFASGVVLLYKPVTTNGAQFNFRRFVWGGMFVVLGLLRAAAKESEVEVQEALHPETAP